MIDFAQMTFKALAVHRVGNKQKQEGILLADELYQLSDENLRNILLDYFLKPFKSDEYYHFFNESGVWENQMYNYCHAIFEDKKTILDNSREIAKHLYNQSNHPKINAGELYVTYFADCLLEDELVDGIGIFKSENKDLYLRPTETPTQLILDYEQGINIKKLDKGCLIFNTFGDEGYRVLIVDKQSRKEEAARYWRDDFLGLMRVRDHGFNTEAYLQMCQLFCEDTYAEEGSRKDEVLFLNKSVEYFTNHNDFDVEEFATEVIEEPTRISEFKAYQKDFEEKMGYVPEETFKISQPMVKATKRYFKKVIELDTHIDIKLKPEAMEDAIERGYDEQKDMYYYKVYYRNEM